MTQIRVATIVGSLRAASLNRRLFEHARDNAPEAMTLVEAPIRELPLYDDDLRSDETETGFPSAVQEFRAMLRGADAILIVAPEYNYSLPAPLKNAIDWASRAPEQPFLGMPVAIMGASGGRLGTARMQYQLRQVLVAVDARVLNRPEVMVAGAREQFGDGVQPQELTTTLIVQLLEALGAWTRTIRA